MEDAISDLLDQLDDIDATIMLARETAEAMPISGHSTITDKKKTCLLFNLANHLSALRVNASMLNVDLNRLLSLYKDQE